MIAVTTSSQRSVRCWRVSGCFCCPADGWADSWVVSPLCSSLVSLILQYTPSNHDKPEKHYIWRHTGKLFPTEYRKDIVLGSCWCGALPGLACSHIAERFGKRDGSTAILHTELAIDIACMHLDRSGCEHQLTRNLLIREI